MDVFSQPVEFTEKDLGRLFIHEIICFEPEIISPQNKPYIEHLKKTYDYVNTFTRFEEVICFLKEAETSIHLVIFENKFKDFEEEISKIKSVSDIYLLGDNISDQKRREDSKICFIGTEFEDLSLILRRNVMRVDFPAFLLIGIDGYKYETKTYDKFIDSSQREKRNIKLMDLAKQKLCSNQAYQIYNKRKISDFIRDQEQFSSEKILTWYANDPFFRRIGNFYSNKRFNIKFEDYSQLVSDISNSIKDQSNRPVNNYNDILFSNTYVSDYQWETLKENLGRDIAIESFLPASEKKEESFKCINNKDKVLITIIVPGLPSEWDLPFVELQEYSKFKDIREVLFDVKSRFRILEVEDNKEEPRQLVLLYEAYSVRRFISFQEPYIDLPNLTLNADCTYCKSTIFNQDEFMFVDLESSKKICEECFQKHHHINGNQQPLLYLPSSKVKEIQNCLGASIKGLLMKPKNISKLPFYGYRCMKCKSKSHSFYTCLDCPPPVSKFCAYCEHVRQFCILSTEEASNLYCNFLETVKIFRRCDGQCFPRDTINKYFPNCKSESFREFLEFLYKETEKLIEMCKECQKLADEKGDTLENKFRSLIQETRKAINNSKQINTEVDHECNKPYQMEILFSDYESELFKLIGTFSKEMKKLYWKGKKAIKTHKCTRNELMKNRLPSYCQKCCENCQNEKHLLVLESCPYTFWSEGLSKEEYFEIKEEEKAPLKGEIGAEYEITNEGGNEEIIIKDSLENIVKLFQREVVWFELNISPEKMRDYKQKLEEISCKAEFFGEPNKAIQYINNIKTPIQVVVSGSDMKLIKDIQKIEIVSRILIFGKEDEIQEEWKKKESKFKCVNNIEDLKGAIKYNQERLEFPAFMPIFNEENYDQVNILHNCLRCLPRLNDKEQAKKDFLALADKVYSNSQKEKESIKEFEENYTASSDKETINWYTKNCFVYKLTNNNLRLATPDSILYCRYFINELSLAIKKRYLEYSQGFHRVLYRAAFISNEEWVTLCKNVGKDIEMYGFLSASQSLKIANFFGVGKGRTLIKILVPPGPLTKTEGFAEISEFSEFEEEEEVLFNIMSRFTILEANEEIIGQKKVKNLVLLYGTQELKKYLTNSAMIDDQYEERKMFIEINIPEPDKIQCNFCRLKMSKNSNFLFYASLFYTNGTFVCHACLEKSKDYQESPLLDRIRSICESPLLCLKTSICNSQTLKIKGVCMAYKNKVDIPFYGYRCAKCGEKNLKRKFYKCLNCPKNKWCESCFQDNNQCQQKEGHLIVLETQPFSFWNEELTKSEIAELANYRQVSVQDAFSQAKIFKQMSDYEREVKYYQSYLNNNGSNNCSKTVAIYRDLASAYLNAGKPEEAVESCRKSLEITKSLYIEKAKKTERYVNDGGWDDDLVYAYSYFGYYCNKAGKYDEAIEACLKSIEIIETTKLILPPDQPYKTLSSVFKKLGQYENEIKYRLLHLKFNRYSFLEDIYDKIGLAYLNLGKFEQAIQNYEMAFKIRGSGEKENGSTATSYQNFGMAYLEAKDYQKAIEFHSKALCIREKIYGKENLRTLSSYQNLGLTYYRQGNYQEAATNYSIALKIQISNEDNSFEAAITHENLGKAYYGLGKYQEAINHHKKALKILESDSEQDPLAIASSYEKLGIAYSGLKKYSETIKFCMKSIEIKTRFMDEYDETFEECYTYLGLAFRGLNQYEKASEYISKALRITIIKNSDQNKQNNLKSLLEEVIKNANDKLNLKARTPDVACLYKILGMSCKTAKKYEEAIKFHSNTLEIRKEILGYKHRDTATSYQDLAATYQDLAATYQDWQKYQEASENYSKALEILKLTLGDNHVETASNYQSLGFVYYEWEKYQEAVENYSKALEIVKLNKGDKDIEMVDVYEGLGFTYWDMKRYKESIEYFIKCLAIQKSILGEQHPYTASSYGYIGTLHNDLGQYQDGLKYHLKALEIRKVTLGYKDLYTAYSYKNLGITYRGLKQYDEATKFMIKSLDIQKSILKSGDLEMAITYEKLGSVCYDLGKYKEAVDYHSEALEIRKSIHKDNHLDIASSYKEIGRAYYGWQKYQEALDNFLKDLQIRMSKNGEAHPDTASSYENIGMVYHGLKQYNKTIEYCTKSLNIKKALFEEDHPSNENSYTFIGLGYLGLGEYEKAKEFLSKALNVMKMNGGDKAKASNLETLLKDIEKK